MNKNFYTLLLALFPLAAMAQPTLNVAQDYNIGTTIKYKKCQGVSPGNSGASQTWNFAGLTALGGSDTLTVSYVAPGSTYPLADVLEKTSDSVYMYLSKSAGTNAMVAYTDSSSVGNDVLLTYTDSTVVAVRPLTYNLANTDTFTGALHYMGFNFPTSGSANTTAINADGYGTLVLPSGTFNNVLRVRSVHMQTNTLTVPPTTVNVKLVTYMWFDALHKAPLMRIDSFISSGTPPVPTSTRNITAYMINETYPGKVPEVAGSNKTFSAFIDNSKLVVKGSFSTSTTHNVFVTNVSGQMLYKTEFPGGQGFLHFEMGKSLPSGMYFITIQEKDDITNTGTIKIVKQ